MSAPPDNIKNQITKDELWAFIDEAVSSEKSDFPPPEADEPVDLPAQEQEPEPNKKPKSLLFIRAGFYLSICLTLICSAMLVYDWWSGVRDQNFYSELSNSQGGADISAQPATTAGDDGIKPEFLSAHRQNNEMVGWIKIDDSIIDFPVMQGKDNDYYLSMNFNKQKSKYGTPFVDYRIDLSGAPEVSPENLIIYGHNLGDGQMFGEFVRYNDTAFYESHPIIKVSSLYGERKFKVFAAIYSNGETSNGYIFPYHMYLDFSGEQQYDAYIEAIRDRSVIDVNTDVKYGDKLLTISTCTYEFQGARFAVFARELRDGESETADEVSMNPDPLYPSAFARLYGGRSDEGDGN